MLNKKSRPQAVNSRIDRLFADLSQEAAAFTDNKAENAPDSLPKLGTPVLAGWKWTCDAQGKYTQLGSEVEAGLHRTEAEFIGKPLSKFGLTQESSRLMLATMSKPDMPQEVDVEYVDREGKIIPVRIYIVSAPGLGGNDNDGWQGYAQQLSSEARKPAIEHRSLDISPSPTGISAAKPEVNQIERSAPPRRAKRAPARKPERIKLLSEQRCIISSEKSSLAIPFQVQENEIGLLEILDDTPGRIWSEDERRLVEQVADQLSLALENARLIQETQAALTETRTLYAITSASTRTLELSETLAGLLDQVLSAVGMESGLISMVDPLTDDLHLVVQQNLPEVMNHSLITNGLHGTLCDLVYRRKDTVSIADFEAKDEIPEYVPDLSGLLRFGFCSYLGVPLVSKDRILGTLCTFGKQPRAGQEAGISLMQVAGQQIGIAIENAQLFQETQARADELAVLNEMGRTLASSLNVHEVTEALYTFVSRLMNTYSFFVGLYDEEKQEMELPVVFTSGRRIFPPIRKLGEALSDYVIRNKVSLLLNGDDITEQQEKLGVRFVGLGDAKPAKSWLGVPLLYGNQILGAVVVQSVDKPYLYTETHRRLLTAVASQAAIAIQNARLFEQTQAALGETANLYQASAELNTAQTYDEILNVLRRNSIAGKLAHHVNLSYFEHPWLDEEPPEWVDVLARWTETPDQEFMARYPLQAYPAIAQLIKPDTTLILEDISTDPRLDETTRELYTRLIKAASAIFVPVVVGFQWVGFINANYPEKANFSEEEVRRVMVLAGQAAVAIQNLRSVAIAENQASEAQRRSQELALINRVVSAMVSSADLRQVLSAVAGELVVAFRLAHASIALLTPERSHLTIVAESSSAGGEPAIGVKIPIQGNQAVEQVLRNRQSTMITNAQTSSMVAPMQVQLHERNIQTIAFFPIIAGGEVIGTISLDSNEKDRVFTPQEMTLAETLVGQISTSIQNANLYEQNITLLDETRRRVQELSVLFELSQSLAGATLASHDIAYIIGQYFIRIMEFPEVSVSLFDVENGELQYLEKLRLDGDSHEPVRVEENVMVRNISEIPAAAKVLQTMKPLVIKLSDRALDTHERRYLLENGLKSQVALPLTVKGLVLGMILLNSWDRERDFSSDQLNLAMTLANSAATALENARLYEGQRETAEQLRELDKLKSQFLANMSHELRTPLNSIIGFSRVILKGIDGPVSDLQKQDLAAINSAGQHLLQLINDVLDISKIEAGKMELAFDDHVNLADLITSAMSTAIGLTKDKPITLVKQIPENLPVVRADPTRIRQVLINFLSNAAKFTDQGTITISAETVKDEMGLPEVMVKVTDTGSGIAKEDQDRLFQPFSQVDTSPTRKVGGSGLGLSISRLLVDLHKGRIGVESDLGKGSTFYFTLPLIHMDAALPIEGNFLEKLGNEKVILTIDDDRAVLNLYERYLVDHGYRVIPLTDPSQAVALARQTHPFAITLDIMMPSIDGWTVLEALKHDPNTREIPVIICSIVEHLEKGFSLGAVGYLTKPLLEEDLIKALNRLTPEGDLKDVLIVDDDPNDLRLVQRILEKRTHYKVRSATGGLEGLVAIQERQPQAVILDLFMPDMDGFALLETMRSDSALAKIPVIIFTAGDLTEEQHTRLAEFSKMMLHKSSFNENELLSNLDNLLSKIKAD